MPPKPPQNVPPPPIAWPSRGVPAGLLQLKTAQVKMAQVLLTRAGAVQARTATMAPPPTRFGPAPGVQTKLVVAPPPTRFAPSAGAQAKAAGSPGHPPPVRLAGASTGGVAPARQGVSAPPLAAFRPTSVLPPRGPAIRPVGPALQMMKEQKKNDEKKRKFDLKVDFSNKKVKHGDEKQGQTILSAISIQYVSDDENSDDYNRVEGDVGNFRRCRQWKLKNPQKGFIVQEVTRKFDIWGQFNSKEVKLKVEDIKKFESKTNTLYPGILRYWEAWEVGEDGGISDGGIDTFGSGAFQKGNKKKDTTRGSYTITGVAKFYPWQEGTQDLFKRDSVECAGTLLATENNPMIELQKIPNASSPVYYSVRTQWNTFNEGTKDRFATKVSEKFSDKKKYQVIEDKAVEIEFYKSLDSKN